LISGSFVDLELEFERRHEGPAATALLFLSPRSDSRSRSTVTPGTRNCFTLLCYVARFRPLRGVGMEVTGPYFFSFAIGSGTDKWYTLHVTCFFRERLPGRPWGGFRGSTGLVTNLEKRNSGTK
jgi:hypothetical protein